MNLFTFVKIAKYVFFAIVIAYGYSAVMFGLDHKSKFVALSKEAVDNAIGKSKSDLFNRERINGYLSKMGVLYHRNDYALDASTFILEKIVIGGALALACLIFAPGLVWKLTGALVAFILGFMVPNFMIYSKDKKDNEAMQDDIVSIYTILKLNAKAGVFISDSLVECQRSVTNGRLKAGLTELNNNILSRKLTLEDSVELFNARFNNEQIDNLTVILRQSLRTGQIANMLDDVSKQIEDINKLRTEQEKIKMQRQTKMMNIAFFVGISALIIYITGYQLVESLGDIMK